MRSTCGSSSKRSMRTDAYLLHSGAVEDEGPRSGGSGGALLWQLSVDGHGNPINKRNAWMTRSVAYVRLVPPGAADTVHYRLQIPDDAGDRIQLRTKVSYRKFAWWYTQWAYAGERDPAESAPAVDAAYDDGPWLFTGDSSTVSGPMKEIPDLPITVMAEAEASLVVIDADAPLLPTPSPEGASSAVRGRWNDYGIGLLLQGDLRGAANAFRRVIEIDPAYPDGPVNLARVLLREGDVEQAIPQLESALELEPGLARAHVFMGMGLRTLADTTRRSSIWKRQGSNTRAIGYCSVSWVGSLPGTALRSGDRDIHRRPANRPRGSAGTLQLDARLPRLG